MSNTLRNKIKAKEFQERNNIKAKEFQEANVKQFRIFIYLFIF